MTFEEWLETQRINGGPHGFECVGKERIAHLWDAAIEDAAKACERFGGTLERPHDGSDYAEAVRDMKY